MSINTETKDTAMTYTFKSITEARSHLMGSGYAFAGFTKFVKNGEFYKTEGLTAILSRKPFGKVVVSIKPA